jgi:periplasmic protein TonB
MSRSLSDHYLTIVTANSLFLPAKQTWEPQGFLLRAIAVSLGLHALALGTLAPYYASDASESVSALPLRAELRRLPVRAVSPAPSFSAPIHPAPVTGKSPSAPTRAAALLVPEKESPVVMPTMTGVASVQPDPASSSAGKGSSGDMSVASTRVALVERSASSGADADGIRQFRLAIAGEARRFRRYPERARREGLSGMAEVRIAVDSGGGTRTAALSRSSGHATLDDVALEMLRKAVLRAELPTSLRGQSFAVLLPVVFEVEE